MWQETSSTGDSKTVGEGDTALHYSICDPHLGTRGAERVRSTTRRGPRVRRGRMNMRRHQYECVKVSGKLSWAYTALRNAFEHSSINMNVWAPS